MNDGTASFIAGFGTTAGMQGCTGVGLASSFPVIIPILAIDPIIDMEYFKDFSAGANTADIMKD